MSWLTENIEENIRNEVELLRCNGFNTTCSCHHENYVEMEFVMDGEISRLDNLLYNHGYRDYKIIYNILRDQGHIYSSVIVHFIKKDRTSKDCEF